MQLIETSDIDVYYIDTKDSLIELINILKTKDLLALDTETYIDVDKINPSALDPHSSKISLIQINYKDNKIPFIIDVVSLGVKTCQLFNKEILLNESIRKIIQNGVFDLKQLYSMFGQWPKNIWCTKVLLQSLGLVTGYKASIFRGHSLKNWTRDYFDINLDKTEATSQWGARPLSKEQIAYSGLDVGAPKNSKYSCILLEGYSLFKHQLDLLNQTVAYTIDQQCMYVTAKMEYNGIYVDKEILCKIKTYSENKASTHKKYLVEELGFTVYTDTIINEEGEWEAIEVIPDKIKTLLNNNKGLVNYINDHLMDRHKPPLTSLQAEEVKNYLDNLEKDAKEDISEEITSKYDSIDLIKNLLNYKKYNKLLSECNKYLYIINGNTNRIHAGFNAIGTATGRMSSSGRLNLQQVSNVQVTINIDKHQF